MILEEQLRRFGLSMKQAIIYLACLKFGTASPAKIAEATKYNRSTCYVNLKKLSEQGLVIQSERHGRRVYSAVKPKRIVKMMDFRARQYTKMSKDMKASLSDFEAIMSGNNNIPKVQSFEGKSGIISALEDTLSSTESIKAYASVDDVENSLPGYYPEYYQRRAKRGIHIDAIFPNTEMARALHKRDKQEDRTSLLVPADKFSFTPEINIYDDKVLYLSWRDEIAALIQSKEMAESQKKIFNLSWAEALRWEKKICPFHGKEKK